MRVESAAAPVPKKTTSRPRSRSEPRGGPGEPGPRGAVEHLHPDPFARRRDRVGVTGDVLALRLQHQSEHGEHRERGSRDQGELDRPTRSFQKRTVGSGSGQPDRTRCGRRSAATARSTPAGSSGNRAASAVRRSRAERAPRLEVIRAVEHPPRPCPSRRSRPSDSGRRRARRGRSLPRLRRGPRSPGRGAARRGRASRAPTAPECPGPRRAARRAATPPEASGSALRSRRASGPPSRPRGRPRARCGPAARRDTSAHGGSPVAGPRAISRPPRPE